MYPVQLEEGLDSLRTAALAVLEETLQLIHWSVFTDEVTSLCADHNKLSGRVCVLCDHGRGEWRGGGDGLKFPRLYALGYGPRATFKGELHLESCDRK